MIATVTTCHQITRNMCCINDIYGCISATKNKPNSAFSKLCGHNRGLLKEVVVPCSDVSQVLIHQGDDWLWFYVSVDPSLLISKKKQKQKDQGFYVSVFQQSRFFAKQTWQKQCLLNLGLLEKLLARVKILPQAIYTIHRC